MAIPAAQAVVADLLIRETGAARPLETPISAVFVGVDRVFKLRKAVRMPFLDFTTLAERERTARREFELNAPHAPGLYRAVRAIVRQANGALTLDGAPTSDRGGEPVDYAVEMAAVPEADFLPAIVERGELTGALLDRIADAVADYHAACPTVTRDLRSSLKSVADGNREAALAAGLPEPDVLAWHEAVTASLAARDRWFAGRQENAFVRRVHGDLHLGNLCLWSGGPVAFDALEFDEALAETDVAYDLAFLLMDLEQRAGRPAANRVLNRYVARTGDHALVGGLPAYLSLRAMVRAHVSWRRRETQEEARDYLTAAMSALAPSPVQVVAVGGLPGSGKSTFARAVAPSLGAAPGALIMRSDEIRKRRHGVRPEAPLTQSAYSPWESRLVFADLIIAVHETAAFGHNVIADATFLDPSDRAAIARAAPEGCPFTGIWLDAPPDVLEARIAARRNDASDANVAVLRTILASNPSIPHGSWTMLDAAAPDLAESGLDVLKAALAKRTASARAT